jgi:endonuclease-3
MALKSDLHILRILERLYPNPRSELNFTSEYELVISVVLSAQCTDKKVNEVTSILFKKYPGFSELAKAKISAIEGIIRQVNYYKTKSLNIKKLAEIVINLHNGVLPKERRELLSLPGVGNKTANVVLGELGIEPTIAVDTHVFRVSNRLGIAKGKTPLAVEQELKQRFPIESWRELHHRLIFHGRRVCKAQNPQCKECELSRDCPSADQF